MHNANTRWLVFPCAKSLVPFFHHHFLNKICELGYRNSSLFPVLEKFFCLWHTLDIQVSDTILDDNKHITISTLYRSFYEGFRWARAGRVRLTKGKHVARWHNPRGGALSLDAFMLCSDPDWEPDMEGRAKPDHVVIWQAESFDRKHGEAKTRR